MPHCKLPEIYGHQPAPAATAARIIDASHGFVLAAHMWVIFKINTLLWPCCLGVEDSAYCTCISIEATPMWQAPASWDNENSIKNLSTIDVYLDLWIYHDISIDFMNVSFHGIIRKGNRIEMLPGSIRWFLCSPGYLICSRTSSSGLAEADVWKSWPRLFLGIPMTSFKISPIFITTHHLFCIEMDRRWTSMWWDWR